MYIVLCLLELITVACCSTPGVLGYVKISGHGWLYCICVLLFATVADAAGVVDRQSIMNLQSRLLSCLEAYVTSRYPMALHRCSRLLLQLSTLRAVSARVAEKFLSLSLEGDVKMNALVLEMMN